MIPAPRALVRSIPGRASRIPFLDPQGRDRARRSIRLGRLFEAEFRGRESRSQPACNFVGSTKSFQAASAFNEGCRHRGKTAPATNRVCAAQGANGRGGGNFLDASTHRSLPFPPVCPLSPSPIDSQFATPVEVELRQPSRSYYFRQGRPTSVRALPLPRQYGHGGTSIADSTTAIPDQIGGASTSNPQNMTPASTTPRVCVPFRPRGPNAAPFVKSRASATERSMRVKNPPF